jgi:hypothetical protein
MAINLQKGQRINLKKENGADAFPGLCRNQLGSN